MDRTQLCAEIRADESSWCLSDGQLAITLEKRRAAPWAAVLAADVAEKGGGQPSASAPEPPRGPDMEAARRVFAMAERMGEAAGASSDEIDEVWASLHAVGMYVDDASHMSIDDELIGANGVPLMKGGVPVRRADAHFAAVPCGGLT